jgi:hypothetical protein
MATYSSFPGVQVETSGGGITAVVVGSEEYLVLFGEADYDRDGQDVQNDGLTVDSADGLDGSNTTASTESAEQINARLEADDKFGSGSELADAMQEALANGANIDYLYGVAPERYIRQETPGTQTGTLSDTPIFENTDDVTVDDGGTSLSVEFRYDGAPATPTASQTMFINPFTGEYAADAAPGTSFTIDYRSLDYDSAFGLSDVQNVVNEDETGVYVSLSESDDVSSNLQSEVSSQRDDYQLISALSPAEPNNNSSESPPDARYDTGNYSNANQSIDSDFYFKLAPTREEDEKKTIMGGVGGLFAGNSISDPIYNDALSGYSSLEESFSKTDADNMRNENVIPVRSAGSVRVKDNLSTSTESDWERDFWRRRITDRVILIAKTVGDSIIGDINDEQTRNAAQRQIESEMRSLVDDRLLKPNTTDTQNWFVDVYEDSSNSDEADIDIGFTPYGVVKRIDASVTINT